ncbi:MAG: hypothetical protein ACFFAN_20685 [Promethearchaeota archaeon]
MLLQIKMRFFPDFIFFFLLPIVAIIDLILLKIGLKITNAEEKTRFKWILASYGIQVSVFLFLSVPFILWGILGEFEDEGPNPLLIILSFLLAMFIDVNILNVIHKLGIKRALFVYGLMMIPVFIAIGIIFSILASAGML